MLILAQIIQLIIVRVLIRIGGIFRIQAVLDFPLVGHAIAVGINYALVHLHIIKGKPI